MNLRPVLKPVAAALLVVGLLTAGVAPVQAATTPTHTTNDTGWGYK